MPLLQSILLEPWQLMLKLKRPILSNKFGGLSGTPIKPIALRCVYEISSKYEIPIIGCGGISTWEDAVEFFLAGAICNTTW